MQALTPQPLMLPPPPQPLMLPPPQQPLMLPPPQQPLMLPPPQQPLMQTPQQPLMLQTPPLLLPPAKLKPPPQFPPGMHHHRWQRSLLPAAAYEKGCLHHCRSAQAPLPPCCPPAEPKPP